MGKHKDPNYLKKYYQQNKERMQLQKKEYNLSHIDLVREQRRIKHIQNKEKDNKRCSLYYSTHKKEHSERTKKYREINREQLLKDKKVWYEEKGWINKTRKYQNFKKEVFEILGNKCSNPNCAVPGGMTDIRALQIDHVNGNGWQEAATIGYHGIQRKIMEGNTKDYVLLCANCNWIKRAENGEFGRYKKNRIIAIAKL
jgi:hypothetical protein